jgi:hypothetical protein
MPDADRPTDGQMRLWAVVATIWLFAYVVIISQGLLFRAQPYSDGWSIAQKPFQPRAICKIGAIGAVSC